MVRRSASDEVRSHGLRGRFSLAHMLILLAGLLAVLLNFAVLRSRDASVEVLVAARDLAPGEAVEVDDVRLVSIGAGDDLLASLFVASSEEVFGRVLVSTLKEGDAIRRSDVRPAGTSSDMRAMSIPIERTHASGGSISVGDAVDVIAVSEGVAEYIAVGLDVIDVAAAGQGGLAGGQFYVTVAVDATTALRLASAMDSGSLEILRSTGAAAPELLEFPAATSPGDAGT